MSAPLSTHSRRRGTTRELLGIALPMVVSQGSWAVMVFCDRLFLAYLGPEHMAAAMAGGVAAFFTNEISSQE